MTTVRRSLRRTFPKTPALIVGLVLAAVQAWAQADFKAVTDQTSYNVGSEVRLRLAPQASDRDAGRPVDRDSRELVASIRFAGEGRPVAEEVRLPASVLSSGAAQE